MLLLSGHDHNYERLALNGVTSIVAGAGSSHLYPMKERLAQSRYFAAVPSYVILDLDHEGVRAPQKGAPPDLRGAGPGAVETLAIGHVTTFRFYPARHALSIAQM